MTHEAGKGDTMRPTNHKAFAEGMDRIFGKREVEEDDEPTCPSCKGTGEMETGIGMMVCDTCHGGEDDEPSCPSCTGPMYTQAHWQYWQCDDCGYTEYKEEMEP